MSVIYTTAVKSSRMTAVATAMGGTAVLEIGTAGMGAILASITLNATPGTTGGTAALTLSGFPKNATASGTGTAAAARIRTGTGGTDIITGLTVGTSGADINLDSTNITSGQTVTVSSAVLNHA